MELVEACDILEMLASGIDPNTGEAYPEDSPYQHPCIVRALYTALLALQRRESRSPSVDHRIPEQAGKCWSPAEDAELAAAFDGGARIADLARKHCRTYGAIRSRLVRLGKLDRKHDWFARRAVSPK